MNLHLRTPIVADDAIQARELDRLANAAQVCHITAVIQHAADGTARTALLWEVPETLVGLVTYRVLPCLAAAMTVDVVVAPPLVPQPAWTGAWWLLPTPDCAPILPWLGQQPSAAVVLTRTRYGACALVRMPQDAAGAIAQLTGWRAFQLPAPFHRLLPYGLPLSQARPILGLWSSMARTGGAAPSPTGSGAAAGGSGMDAATTDGTGGSATRGGMDGWDEAAGPPSTPPPVPSIHPGVPSMAAPVMPGDRWEGHTDGAPIGTDHAQDTADDATPWLVGDDSHAGFPLGATAEGQTVQLTWHAQTLAIQAPPDGLALPIRALIMRALAGGMGVLAVLPPALVASGLYTPIGDRLRMLDARTLWQSASIPWTTIPIATRHDWLAGIVGDATSAHRAQAATIAEALQGISALSPAARALVAPPGDDLSGTLAACGGIILVDQGDAESHHLALLLGHAIGTPDGPILVVRPPTLTLPPAVQACAIQLVLGTSADAHADLIAQANGWRLVRADATQQVILRSDLADSGTASHSDVIIALLQALTDAIGEPLTPTRLAPLPPPPAAASFAQFAQLFADASSTAARADVAPRGAESDAADETPATDESTDTPDVRTPAADDRTPWPVDGHDAGDAGAATDGPIRLDPRPESDSATRVTESDGWDVAAVAAVVWPAAPVADSSVGAVWSDADAAAMPTVFPPRPESDSATRVAESDEWDMAAVAAVAWPAAPTDESATDAVWPDAADAAAMPPRFPLLPTSDSATRVAESRRPRPTIRRGARTRPDSQIHARLPRPPSADEDLL